MKTRDYLNEIKLKTGIKSDYALAKHLGITRSAVSRYQCGDGFFSDEIAIKVASELGLNAGIVLADIHAERETNPQIQAAWIQIGRSLQQATMAVFMIVMLALPAHTAEAATNITAVNYNFTNYILCELVKMLKKSLSKLTYRAICAKSNAVLFC